MRILELVTSPDWGGAQAQVLAITTELLARGHQVHVAAGGGGELFLKAKATGAVTHQLRWLRPSVVPYADLLAVREIAALLDDISPAVLHTHSSKAGVLGRSAAAFVAVTRRSRRSPVHASVRIPARTPAHAVARAAAPVPAPAAAPPPLVVHTCHGLAWGPGRRGGVPAAVFRTAERLTGRWCAGVICVSEDLRRSVADQRLYPRARLTAISNGVDLGEPGPGPFSPAAFAARRKLGLGLPSPAPLLVLTGRMVPGKGHDVALAAVALLSRAGRAVSIAFAGDGPLRGRLEAASRGAREASAQVSFLGHRQDVAAILRAADVFVLPSSAEGLPLAVLEAMAAGLPVVASRIAGMNEAVVHGETGLLFELSAGPAAVAGALEPLIAQPDLARRMGAAGRKRAETRFSLHNTSRAADFLDDIARCSESGHSGTPEALDG
ncbi:MAG: glycosyltransferase family 4 protein [Bacillota bacterium]|nr:glycosyltransferase family 4 protein [Bacillota bacterium]